MIDVTHFTDPGCPWAYSAWPAHTTLRWRYGEQLRWTLVTIGLAEDAGQYAARGLTPTLSAIGYARFRRFGMPFQITPKARLGATSPACRAIVATRLAAPKLEDAALRALALAQFTTTGTLDDPGTLRQALAGVEGLDADAVIARIEDPEVVAAYEADRARARTAAGSPTELQGRAANSDGAVRYTAPSLVFDGPHGRSLEAGGFQPIEAYDVVVANLDPTLERRPPAQDPLEVLAAFPYALTTPEVAAVMTEHLDVPDLAGVEAALVTATGEGRAARRAAGDGSLWALAGDAERPHSATTAAGGTSAQLGAATRFGRWLICAFDRGGVGRPPQPGDELGAGRARGELSDRPRRSAAFGAERVVERDRAGTGLGQREDRREHDQVVLVSPLGDPRSLAGVDVADGRDHHARERRSRKRSEEARDQQRSTSRLGRTGSKRVAPPGSDAHVLEELPRRLGTVAAEPTEQLLSAMADEEPADHRAYQHQPQLHTCTLSAEPPSKLALSTWVSD